MFILLIDLLRLRTWTGYKQRVLLAMTSFRGFRVMIRQPTIRDLMTALIKTVGPVSTVFLLGRLLPVLDLRCERGKQHIPFLSVWLQELLFLKKGLWM